MMEDLTGKVLNMLDDPNLEAVMLTQYVTVLRLMSAPRQKVAGKLLCAHRRRSMNLVQQFQDKAKVGVVCFLLLLCSCVCAV
jgi:hypothetical protein